MKKYKKKINVKSTSRKELRKEKRRQKKFNKNNFFSKKKQIDKLNKKKYIKTNELIRSDESEVPSDFELEDKMVNEKLAKIKQNLNDKNENVKKIYNNNAHESDEFESHSNFKFQDDNENKKSNKLKENNNIPKDRFREQQVREIKQKKNLEKHMQKRRIEQLRLANEEEDLTIRRLEKKLKINKHKNDKSVHKMFNDGLDYALELCLPENMKRMHDNTKEVVEVDETEEFEKDFEIVENRSKNNKIKLASNNLKNTNLMSDFSETDSELDLNNSNTDTEESLFEDNSVESNEKNTVQRDLLNKTKSHQIKLSQNMEKNPVQVWEDIYGRPRDEKGNIIKENNTKYVPPHLKNKLQFNLSDDNSKHIENLLNLKRQCKGLFNRLSESNIYKILSELETLYTKKSRFDMNETLVSIISETFISNVIASERFILEHCMLIALLHAYIGSEVGAHILQVLVTTLNKRISEIKNLNIENKELDNIIFFICHLYTFKIFQHNLIFQLVNKLSEYFCEKSIECILLVLRSVGFQMRKDDPLALKEFIISSQKKANTLPDDLKENPRLKFMLDILNAIKNNNVNRIPQYDPSLAEHLKKILKSMLTNGKYISTLNITMEDLLSADVKGKWWIVGSAWSGNISNNNTENQIKSQENVYKFSDKLLVLAKKQRMNTTDRRNVFCIIMSAEDYIDAFERLLHLSIKDHRIIVTIILHCCLSEKIFNLYYCALAQKFCDFERKYQLALQFAIWDKIKEIHSASEILIKNLGKFITHIVLSGGIALSVLKIVEFAALDKVTLRLVRQILLGLLLVREEDCKQVFERIAPSNKLNKFKDSIRLFMHHFLLKGGNKSNIPIDKINKLKERISLADRLLESIDSKVKF